MKLTNNRIFLAMSVAVALCAGCAFDDLSVQKPAKGASYGWSTCPTDSDFAQGLQLAGANSSIVDYRSYVGDGMPYDVLRVQIFEESIGKVKPGVWNLDGGNFADCDVCVTITSGCSVETCDKIFFASAGKVEITAIGKEGDRFAATLKEIALEEVTIDENTYESTPVENGETRCIGNLSFDRQLDGMQQSRCDRPTLNCVGEKISDFALKSCDSGKMVKMSSLAKGKKAMLFAIVTEWCPYCREWLPEVAQMHEMYSSLGLEVVYVIGENAERAEPTLENCRAYAELFDDPAKFFIDHDGKYSFVTTTSNMWPFVVDSGEFALPWNVLVNAETFDYVYTSQPPGSGDFETELNGLLGI